VYLASAEFHLSDTFWAAAGTIVALLIGIVTVWVTLRAASPKRAVLYWTGDITPLLNTRADLPRLKVSLEPRSRKRRWRPRNRELEFPHSVNVLLTSRGRDDIAPAAFGGRPLCLDIGAPIVEFLKIKTTPDDRQIPRVRADGAKLLVEPVLIGRRETITFSLLVDGPSPRISPPEQSLINVDIHPWDPASENAVLRRTLTIIAAIMAIVALAYFWRGVALFLNAL